MNGTTDSRVRDAKVFRGILWTAGILSSIAVISVWIFGAYRLYERNFQWQRAVSQEMMNLHAGYSINYFKSQLGVPVETHVTSKGFTEESFKGRGFWVEALTKESNEVLFYSATVRDSSITPKFVMPSVGTVTLNRSSLASITSSAQYNYWFMGLGGSDSPTMKEFDYAGFQGDYRDFMWGLSSACSDSFHQMLRLQTEYKNLGASPLSKTQLREVRKEAIANVYGETAPGISLSKLPNAPEELGINPVSVDLVSPFFGNQKSGGGRISACSYSELWSSKKAPECGS